MSNAQLKNDSVEMRTSARIEHSSPVQIKDIQTGNLHRAKMQNYSREGLYFESDSMLNAGMSIYLGIKNSPYAAEPDVLEYRRAEILWRQKLKQSFYQFGYGVKLHTEKPPVAVPTNKTAGTPEAELRRHPRKACRKPTLLADEDTTFKGEVRNVSLSGVFITAEKALRKGQLLTISVPGKGGKRLDMEGRVAWCGPEGCGIKIKRIEKIMSDGD